MRILLLGFIFQFSFLFMHAQVISGTIVDQNNEILPFSSVLIKGTTRGVSANSKGVYTIQLQPGSYTFVCQYIGYAAVEKKAIGIIT